MSEPARSRPNAADRRASRRRSPRSSIRIECRKGSHGLGRNLVKRFLDLSETGIRLLLREELPVGEEAEILLEPRGTGKPLKRMARVVWAFTAGPDGYCAGLRFDKPLTYVYVQDIATPLSSMR
jgi:hypothetical protein